MAAKFYTYRNLNRNLDFSTKHLGLVVDRFETGVMHNVKLIVSEKGRERVLRTKKRCLHAFVVSDMPSTKTEKVDTSKLREVKYNPYRSGHFTVDDEVVTSLKKIYFQDGKAFTDMRV